MTHGSLTVERRLQCLIRPQRGVCLGVPPHARHPRRRHAQVGHQPGHRQRLPVVLVLVLVTGAAVVLVVLLLQVVLVLVLVVAALVVVAGAAGALLVFLPLVMGVGLGVGGLGHQSRADGLPCGALRVRGGGQGSIRSIEATFSHSWGQLCLRNTAAGTLVQHHAYLRYMFCITCRYMNARTLVSCSSRRSPANMSTMPHTRVHTRSVLA